MGQPFVNGTGWPRRRGCMNRLSGTGGIHREEILIEEFVHRNGDFPKAFSEDQRHWTARFYQGPVKGQGLHFCARDPLAAQPLAAVAEASLNGATTKRRPPGFWVGGTLRRRKRRARRWSRYLQDPRRLKRFANPRLVGEASSASASSATRAHKVLHFIYELWFLNRFPNPILQDAIPCRREMRIQFSKRRSLKRREPNKKCRHPSKIAAENPHKCCI